MSLVILMSLKKMNDFTKEELKIILLEMNISINRHKDLLTIAPSYQALRDKVESMIDNYCEHKQCGEAEVFVDVCQSCNCMILRNKTLDEYNE